MPSSNNASAGMGNSSTKSNNVSSAPTVVSGGGGLQATRSLGDLNGGGYTFSDTAAVALASYSYDIPTDTHTFNTNTIGVGNETYSLLSGANFTSPKWRAPLTYSDGSPVLVGDAFSLDVRFDNFSVGASRSYLVAVCVVESASSTVIGTMRPSGVYGLTTAVGTPGVGIVADNLGAAGTVASMVSGVGTVAFSGGTAVGSCGKAGGSCIARSATTISSNTRGDGNTWASASTGQLALAIMLSTNGTVATTGGALAMRIKYNIAKLS
jgi:hypothetical protein